MRSHGPRRSILPAAMCAFWLAAAGCGTSSPPAPASAAAPAAPAALAKQPAPPPGPPAGAALRLWPSSEARPLLMASVSIPSLDRTLTGAVALLSHAVPLPLDAAGVKETLLTQAGLPPKVGENLDTGNPTGVVVVATGGKDVAGLVMAIPAKGVEPARVVIGALGSVVARRGDVVQIDNGSGGRGWVWLNGAIIVLSDSVDALGRGAMLALDARRSGNGEDVTAVVYPAPIARANGTDLRTALTAAIAVARAARAAQVEEAAAKAGAKAQAKGKIPAAGGDGTDHSFDVLEDLAGYLADTNTLEIGLVTDEARGLIVNLRVHPLPGTPFEKLTAEGKPFAIDPALLRKPQDIAMLGASSYGPFLRGQIARKRQRLLESKDKGAVAAAEFLDTSVAAMEGSWSSVGRLRPSLSVQAVYPLKDEASAAKLSAALARFDNAVALAFLRSQLAPDQLSWFDVKVKKDTVGKLKVLHYTMTIDAKALQQSGRDAVKKVLGGNALDVYFTVAGKRAVMAAGKDAKARLPELARATPATGGDKPEHDLAEAIAAARDKDSFGYFDLGQVIGFAGALSDDARIKAVAAGATAPIPTYVTFTNDAPAKQMTFTWTIPPDGFNGAGALLQGLSGGMNGGGAGP